MVDLPPIVIGLVQILYKFLALPFATLVVLSYLRQLTELNLPTWAVILVSLLSKPLVGYVQGWITERADSLEAASRGAVLAPKLQGSELGLTRKIAKSGRSSIPGVYRVHHTQH